MAKTKYNVNELLERKKELETKIQESLSVRQQDLTFSMDTIVDLTGKQKDKVLLDRPKVTLAEFGQKYMGLVDELSKIKTALATFNAKNTSDLLYKREQARNIYNYLTAIKSVLKVDSTQTVRTSQVDVNQVPLEKIESIRKPMFSHDDLEKLMDETAAYERKLNTEIQKINLNAAITL